MAKVGTVKKQLAEVQDYDIDFSQWMPVGDSVVSAVLTCTPAWTGGGPPTFAIQSPRVKVWVYQGGVDGTSYKIQVRATTNDGRVNEAELIVKVKEI